MSQISTPNAPYSDCGPMHSTPAAKFTIFMERNNSSLSALATLPPIGGQFTLPLFCFFIKGNFNTFVNSCVAPIDKSKKAISCAFLGCVIREKANIASGASFGTLKSAMCCQKITRQQLMVLIFVHDLLQNRYETFGRFQLRI